MHAPRTGLFSASRARTVATKNRVVQKSIGGSGCEGFGDVGDWEDYIVWCGEGIKTREWVDKLSETGAFIIREMRSV